MDFKHYARRPVPVWLSSLPLSQPSDLQECSCPIDDLLANSLYYPAAHFDGRPVEFVGGYIHSFIYVDYSVTEQEADEVAVSCGFRGYKLVGRRQVSRTELTPNEKPLMLPRRFRGEARNIKTRCDFIKRPFATWYIFDRLSSYSDLHGPERFSLLYICADGIATYDALFRQRAIAPDVLAISHPGTGYGGNYTDFTDQDGFFANVVRNGTLSQPKFMMSDVWSGNEHRPGRHRAYWDDIYTEILEHLMRRRGEYLGLFRMSVES